MEFRNLFFGIGNFLFCLPGVVIVAKTTGAASDVEQTNDTHAADVGARRREERSRRKCRLRSAKTLVPKTKLDCNTK